MREDFSVQNVIFGEAQRVCSSPAQDQKTAISEKTVHSPLFKVPGISCLLTLLLPISQVLPEQ
jgi:hypothetical protein